MFKDATAFSSFSSPNLAETKTFYQDVLGCHVEENEMGLRLHLRDSQGVYIYHKDDHVPAVFTILNFQVASIDTTIKELLAHGVTMERYESLPAPQDELGVLRGKSVGMGPDIAWFKDNVGNILSVMEV